MLNIPLRAGSASLLNINKDSGGSTVGGSAVISSPGVLGILPILGRYLLAMLDFSRGVPRT